MARPTLLQSLFGRARSTAAVPVAEVAADRKAAGVELLAAQRAVEEADIAYSAGLLDLSADLPALDDARRAAARKHDQVKALIRAFEDQHVAAQAAERQAELARIVAEADARVAEFRQAVENDLPLLGVAARGILRLWAEAELAQETANRAIAAAEAGEPRPPVEAFRASAGRPERTLRSEHVEVWVDERGEPAGHQEAIVRQSDGSGYLRLPSATHGRTFRHKRTFERKEVLAAESGRAPTMLAASMMIPGIMIGDQPAWVPLSDPTPSKVLAQLDRLERSIEPEGDARQPKIMIRHLPGEQGRIVEVAKPAHVPNLRAS